MRRGSLQTLLRLSRRDQHLLVHVGVLKSSRLQRLGGVFFVSPLAVAALTLHELVARHVLALEQATLDLCADGLAPVLHQTDLAHRDRQVVVAEAIRHVDRHEVTEVVDRRCAAVGDDLGHLRTQGWAVCLRLAEAALLLAGFEERPGHVVPYGQIEALRQTDKASGSADLYGELPQFLRRDDVLTDVVEARHVDDHDDLVEVSQHRCVLIRAEGVHHQLRVVLGVDAHAHAILQVDDRQAACTGVHDDRVGRACRAMLTGQVADRHGLLDQ